MLPSSAHTLGLIALFISVAHAVKPSKCAISCSQSSESNSTCSSLMDLNCVCSNNVYADAVLACVQKECPDQLEEITKFGCDTCKNSLDHCKPPVAQPVTPPVTEPTPTEPETGDKNGQAAAVLVNPPAAVPAEGLPLVKHLAKTKCRRPMPMTKPPKPCPCHRKKGSKQAVIIPECAETIKFAKKHHHHRGRKHRHHRPKPCNCTC